MITTQLPEDVPTQESVHLRRAGDGDVGNCQTCANWGLDGNYKILGISTPPVMVCDLFSPLEGEATPQSGDLMSALMGGGM